MKYVIATVSMVAALGAGTAAQDIRYAVAGDNSRDGLGGSLAVVGDWDGDGVSDWAASTSITSPSHPVGAYVRVFSGALGTELYTFNYPLSYGSATWYGRRVAALGDANGDGIPDLAIGGSYSAVLGSGYVEIRSGADGSLFQNLINPTQGGGNYGYSLDSAGDLNDDGFADVLISTPYTSTGGFVEVRSGVDGLSLLTLEGEGPGSDFLFGASSRHLGDVTGDGIDDYLVSAPTIFDAPYSLDSFVRVYSGADGSVVYELSTGWDGFGTWIHAAQDVTGDGRRDFFVTQSYEYGEYDVLLYSGATGQLVTRVQNPEPTGDSYSTGFGVSIVEASGVVPGVTGPIYAFSDSGANHGARGAGKVHFINVLTNELVYTLMGTTYSEALGSTVAPLDDLDGDGYREILVRKPSDTWPDFRGQVMALDLEAGSIQRYCSASPNSEHAEGATIFAGPSTSISDNQLSLNAGNLVLGQTSVYIASQSAAFTPFGDGALCVGSPVFRIAYPPQSSYYTGAPVTLDLPSLASGAVVVQPGSTWRFQLLYRDPGGVARFNLTDALAVTFAP